MPGETSTGKRVSLFYRFYNALLLLGFSIGFPLYCPFVLLSGRHRRGLPERLGFKKSVTPVASGRPRVWLHAASVGEVQTARALLPALRDQLPGAVFLLSTMTEQGRAVAISQLESDVECFLAPLDLPFAVKKVTRRVRPDLYICLETELWPNLLRQLKETGAELVLLNGRLSERSLGHYLKIRGLMREVLSCFSRISVIQPVDAERFIMLGAAREKVVINGNAKYDLARAPDAQTGEKYRRLLKLEPEQRVLIAGSTRQGEERLLVAAYQQLRKKWPDLICILAPRHLERLSEVRLLLDKAGENFELLSELRKRDRIHSIVLVDTMGELADIYAVGTYIFCGGSLVKRGGHNIMEAAVWGKPVFYGPYMNDFADAKELLETAGAGFKVDSAENLSAAITALAENPGAYGHAARQAGAAVLRQQGSARRQARLAAEALKNLNFSLSPGACRAQEEITQRD
jgi:3-deoxy-D-manno-octulosonic-acid transferase